MAERRSSSRWRDDLKSTLRTRQELGEEMEDEVVESFLERLEKSTDELVEARVADVSHKTRSRLTWRLAAVLGSSIVLIAIAGGVAGLGGVLAVVALVLVLLLKL